MFLFCWTDQFGSGSLCCKHHISVWSRVGWSCCPPFCVLAGPLRQSSVSLPLSWGVVFNSTPPLCAISCKALPGHSVDVDSLHISYADIFTDTPQFRGINPYFFSENLYQSVSFIYASTYSENVHAIHIAMQFTKKIATLYNKNRQPVAMNQNRSFTSRGASVGLGLCLWLTRSIVLHGRRNLPFFGN